MARLEQHVRQNSVAGYAHFLLAYHYITLGHTEKAQAELLEVVRLDRTDRLGKDLLDLLQESTQEDERRTVGNVPTPQQLQGDWKARRSDGSIELEVDEDRFTWDYDLDSNDEKFKGRFVFADDLLVFATPHGSQMAGRVRMIDEDTFTFRLISEVVDDVGIVFRRD